MQPLPPIPANISPFADVFCDMMGAIWADTCEPLPDGGLQCRVSEWYDEWANARKAAKVLGARRLYSSGANMPEPCDTWQFQDGTRVHIWRDGSGVRLVKRRG